MSSPYPDRFPEPTQADAKSLPGAIGAFIFDVDGVISDTARLHTAAWKRLTEEEQLVFDAGIADSLRGISREASLSRLLGDRSISAERFAEMMDRKNRYYVASLESLNEASLLPGIRQLVSQLANLGVGLGVASASKNARTVLAQTGMDQYFSSVVDGNDTNQSAPSRDRFLLAAKALRVEPGRCVVIEDSTAGIAAAREIGMKSVGVGEAERLCAATLVFESLRGVEAEALIHWLAKTPGNSPALVGELEPPLIGNSKPSIATCCVSQHTRV